MIEIRRRYQFYGRVQGVGFRYTAIRAANAFDVSGWVRNERDGSVTVEAQGSEAALSRMMDTIRNGRYIVIDRPVFLLQNFAEAKARVKDSET